MRLLRLAARFELPAVPPAYSFRRERPELIGGLETEVIAKERHCFVEVGHGRTEVIDFPDSTNAHVFLGDI
jgi:hypothetical protein